MVYHFSYFDRKSPVLIHHLLKWETLHFVHTISLFLRFLLERAIISLNCTSSLVFIMEKHYVDSEVGTEYFSSFGGRTLLQEAVSRRSERSTWYWYSSFWIYWGQTGTRVGFLPSNSEFPCHHSSSDPHSFLSSCCSTLIKRIDCEAQETTDTRQTVFFLKEGGKLGRKISLTYSIRRMINSFLDLWSTLSLQTRTFMCCVFKFLCSPPYSARGVC